MTDSLNPIITELGFQELFNAELTGLNLSLTHIGLGDGAYTPTANRTTLEREQECITIADGSIDGKTLCLNALVQSEQSYWVRELGIYTESGVLFALWSHPDRPLAYKSADAELQLTTYLAITGVPADVITVSNHTSNNLQLCSELATLSAVTIDTLNRQLMHTSRLLTLESTLCP